MTKVVVVENIIGRWIIQLKDDSSLAWSGSRWAEHDKGVGFTTQIANFTTMIEAVQFAKRSGFEVVEIEQEFV